MTATPDDAAQERAQLIPQPRRELLTSRRQYLEAFDGLLALVRRELRVFDPDGMQLELNSPARSAALRQFLLASPDNRLFVVVHDPEHIKRSCPRMLDCLRDFSTAIAIHQSEGEAARAQDCFVLADGEHFVRRPVAAQPRGVYALSDRREAHLMRERFDEIWQSSVPAVSATTLGL
ncbi:MAG: hypothetical protein U1F45_19235 [Burkholderiales bacterium]